MDRTEKQVERFVETTYIYEDTKRVTAPEDYKKSYHKRKYEDEARKSKYEDEDDKGSVQDCFTCGFAYFSRWETDKPFSVQKPIPSPKDLVCFNCVTQRIFDRNIKALKTQQH